MPSTYGKLQTPDHMQRMQYEHRGQPPISTRLFLVRMVHHTAFLFVVVIGSVALGTAGYHWIDGSAWLDGFVNACMLLGGMGPVGELETSGGKVFAALFALYAGLVFLIGGAVLLTPILHRVMHKYHWDAEHQGTGATDD
jgi:hypothetical protein